MKTKQNSGVTDVHKVLRSSVWFESPSYVVGIPFSRFTDKESEGSESI